ncbi:MAG: HD domain-containing protein [Candidatus Cardinium sp.]|nr:hypothetical protein [Candidatus Cardinium sp.]
MAYQYGRAVAHRVDKIRHMDGIEWKKISVIAIENKQKIADYKDIRVIMVKLVDRLHNLKTIGVYALEK